MARERRIIDEEEETINLLDLWDALKQKKKFIAKVTGVCVALGVAVTLALNPGYESKAMLKVQPPRSLNKSMLDTMELTNDRLAAQYMATYGQLMTSRSVINEVIRGLKNPEDEGKDINTLYEGYSKRIKTTPVKNATIMEVTITGKDEESTKKFAQLLFQAFFTKVASMDQGTTKNASNFVASQLQTAKTNMEKAEQNLRDFQSEQKMLSPDEDVKMAAAKLTMANNIKAQAEVGLKTARAQLESISGQLSQNGHIMAENDLIKEYQKKLAELAAKKVGLEEKYTNEHPAVIQINEEISGVQNKLQQEINNVVQQQSTSSNKSYQDLLAKKINSEVDLAVNQSRLVAVQQIENEYAKDVERLSTNKQKYVNLTREVNVTKDIYVMLSKRLEESKVAATAENGAIQMVDPPTVMKAKRKGVMKVGIAFFVGLLGSCGLIIGKELLHPTIKHVSDIEERLGLKALTVIPSQEAAKLNAYRKLRSSLMALPEKKIIMFTSSLSGEGRSTICQSLAELLAKTGLQTALVTPAGLVALTQGTAFKTTEQDRLVTAIQEEVTTESGEVLASKTMTALLEQLKNAYDYVIVDAPALDASSDAAILANKVDGVVDLIKAGVVAPDRALRDLEELEQDGAKLLGAVLVEQEA